MATAGGGRHAVRRGRRPVRAIAIAVVLATAAVLVPAAPASADGIRDTEYWIDDYGFDRAWERSTGEGVTVAIIDSGVDADHPDLKGAVVGGTDVSGLGSADGTKGVGSTPEHGTLVASILAGRGHGEDDEDGIVGVAPDADLLTISVGFGVPGLDTDDQIAEAVRWAVDHGADVINMSLTRNDPDWPTSWDDAFQYAFEHDVVVVAAAGNRIGGTDEVGAPATIPGVLTVAGLTRDGDASEDASSQGITVGVSAPSEGLVGAIPGGGYASWEGTSGAAPMVAGLAALIRSEHPELDAANVIERIVATAEAKTDTVPDTLYGYGAIDARRAVRADVPLVTANPMGDLDEWIRVYRRADPVETPAPPPATDEPASPVLGWVAQPAVQPDPDPTVPLIAFGCFLIVLITLMVAAGRQFWRLLRADLRAADGGDFEGD